MYIRYAFSNGSSIQNFAKTGQKQLGSTIDRVLDRARMEFNSGLRK